MNEIVKEHAFQLYLGRIRMYPTRSPHSAAPDLMLTCLAEAQLLEYLAETNESDISLVFQHMVRCSEGHAARIAEQYARSLASPLVDEPY